MVRQLPQVRFFPSTCPTSLACYWSVQLLFHCRRQFSPGGDSDNIGWTQANRTTQIKLCRLRTSQAERSRTTVADAAHQNRHLGLSACVSGGDRDRRCRIVPCTPPYSSSGWSRRRGFSGGLHIIFGEVGWCYCGTGGCGYRVCKVAVPMIGSEGILPLGVRIRIPSRHLSKRCRPYNTMDTPWSLCA